MRTVFLSVVAVCSFAVLATNAAAQDIESTSFIPAQIIETPQATPPAEAIESGLGGTVRVKVSIAASGMVTSVDDATGPDATCRQITRADVVALREAAKVAALTAKFHPATDKGQAIASSTWINFDFPGTNALPEQTYTAAAPASEQTMIRSTVPETAGSKASDKMAVSKASGSNDPPPDYKGPVNTEGRGEVYAAAPPRPSPRKIPKQISGGILNGKATNLVKPPYPPAARAVRATGEVSVQVLVDHDGSVFAAEGISGHPLLRSASTIAACESRFAPTLLSGQPVKIIGVITYNFVP